MKITYTPNPLRTIVELDEHEKKEFWLKVKISEMKWMVAGAHFYLTPQFFDVEKAQRDLRYNDQFKQEGEEKSKLDQRVDMLYEYYLQALTDIHMGDCVRQPCSCEKCAAESILGIDTMPGLRAAAASKISGQFWKGTNSMDEHSLDEVLASLSTYEPKADWDGWESHVDRWKAEGKAAYEWLKAYKAQHFSG